MSQPEIERIIRQLKKNEIRIFDIPEEYSNNTQIVNFERNAGLRVTGKRGFDIISNSFFVEESLCQIDSDNEIEERNVFLSFDSFDSYFEFLNGDIYNNACYSFSSLTTDKAIFHKANFDKLTERKSFVEDTIDDYSLSPSNDEIIAYKNAEQTHKQCLIWTRKFDKCSCYDEFVKTIRNFHRSKIAATVDLTFFIFQYIFADIEDRNRFNTIMEYLSTAGYPQSELVYSLCSIYDPDEVLNSFNYSLGVKQTRYRQKRKLKDHIRFLKSGKIKHYARAYFDEITHYFFEETHTYINDEHVPIATICQFFESFEEFVHHRNGNLTYCDLSAMLECTEDFSKYTIDETTKLPACIDRELTPCVKKYYRDGKFCVTQQWINKAGYTIKEYRHTFSYFFDFVAFLKGDLSDADLLFCDGLENLEKWDFINFTGARMKSSLCEKFGIPHDTYTLRQGSLVSFECVKKNEAETALVFQSSRDLISEAAERNLTAANIIFESRCQRVYYVSDLHLIHRIKNANCRSTEDVIYVIQKIADTFAEEAGSLLLIDGDVASDFNIFQLFVKLLSKALRRRTIVIFTLGNHELWSFPDLPIDEIVQKYRSVLEQYGMYLLHNDLLYKEEQGLSDSSCTGAHMIKYQELCQMNEAQLSNCLQRARYVVFGGLGFSGYNASFNADNGIYLGCVSREEEVKESQIFEKLYNRIYPILSQKNTVILTHTPKADWCKNAVPDKNCVYVSGHTHRNEFYDDGEYRVYSDNQIGYRSDNPHLKIFLLDNDYDLFSGYADGIFEITSEQYNDFYRGKNIPMTFQREVNILYMLKKNGYYCFIHESSSGKLYILNGGAIKRLNFPYVQYYYDTMDAMIAKLKKPLDKYSSLQNKIADIVRKIGGIGAIHGCIIDIDLFNHIYVNPVDLSLTGYWAADMVCKTVYPSIPTLLEENCPKMFDRYIMLLEENNENVLTLKQEKSVAVLPQVYLNTDIYRASREVKKMQKLNSNILSFWYGERLCEKEPD